MTDPLPQYTTFADIGQGGHFGAGEAQWTNQTVPAGELTSLTFSVAHRRQPAGLGRPDRQRRHHGHLGRGSGTTGSPFVTPIADESRRLDHARRHNTQGAQVGEQTTFHETVHNDGYADDSYDVSVSGNQWTATVYAADCTTPLTTTGQVTGGDSTDVCVKVDVPAGAANDATDDATLTATSTGAPSVSATATLTSIAVSVDTLLVDNDTNDPVDSQPYYTDALDANSIDYSVWDLANEPDLPQSYLTAHTKVVWFTGNSYPAPLGATRTSSRRSSTTAAPVHVGPGHPGPGRRDDGLRPRLPAHQLGRHGGPERQGHRRVHGVAGNPVTNGIGAVPLDHSVLKANFEDQITPNGGARRRSPTTGATDALTFSGSGYKVVFAAFPFEAYGTASDKADLMNRTFSFFG